MSALSQQELAQALETLKGWSLDNDTIVKTYQFENYLAGLAFATTAGTIAEAHNHHPDITIGYRKVTLRFTTHDAGNKITQKDIDVAKAIEAVGYPKT
ncbi:MAG: 4a-hydroxytetrahydrobiopterin dehydratase [Phototrophicales bacterium]|nr:MAG: 4a-hydroxytetrahydrobiopterin dehydratase [Phototrophicales bacterium]RMG73161.1 MAG: 4a-hydroxytetrahydrobiopterin dehydratase [Chloroflexota bacterium]